MASSFSFLLILGFVCTSFASVSSSQCDPEGTLREFSIFERTIHRTTNKKCLCRVGFVGSRCERAFRCVSGRPFAVNCTDIPPPLESLVKDRCPPGVEREITVCVCFPGYHGPRCEFMESFKEQRVLSLRENYHQREETMDIAVNELEDTRLPTLEAVEVMSVMERRFWYLAFCLSLASVIAVLLIGIYFFVMQNIYKSGLRHLALRELRRRAGVGNSKSTEDTISLPPPYYEEARILMEENTLSPAAELAEETVNDEEISEEPEILYRRTYLHV